MDKKSFRDESTPVVVEVLEDGYIYMADGNSSAKFPQKYIPSLLKQLHKGARYLAGELDVLRDDILRQCPGTVTKTDKSKNGTDRFQDLAQESESS